MRYKDISGKEMIDLSTGTRLGLLGEVDLEINRQTGHIQHLVIKDNKLFNFHKEDHAVKIKWRSIKKIGADMILIDET